MSYLVCTDSGIKLNLLQYFHSRYVMNVIFFFALCNSLPKSPTAKIRTNIVWFLLNFLRRQITFKLGFFIFSEYSENKWGNSRASLFCSTLHIQFAIRGCIGKAYLLPKQIALSVKPRSSRSYHHEKENPCSR